MSIYYRENEKFLKESLNSICHQKKLPKQVVLVLDGIPAHSLLVVVDSFTNYCDKNDIEVTIIRHKSVKGLGISLEEGLKKCRFKYTVRADSDDISLPNRVEREINFLQNNQEYIVVGTNITEFTNDINNPLDQKKVPEKYDQIRYYAKHRNPMNHMSVVFKTKEIISIGGYEDLLGFEDYFLWIKAINSGFKMYNIQESLVFARINENFFNRRSGFSYFKNEIRFQFRIFRNGYVNFLSLIFNLLSRSLVRMLPKRLVGLIYLKLRKKYE